jgi:hypothetical protein
MHSGHEHKKRLSTTDLTLTALFSAAYVAYSEISSLTIGGVTHGVDTFVIRSVVFVVLAASTMKFGPSTLMGAISGAIFTFIVPTPVPIYLFPALLLYGLTYDLYMRLTGFSTSATKTKHVAIATILSSAMMSLTALTILTWTGFLPVNGFIFIWTFGVLRDVAVGLVGGLLGLEIWRHAFLTRV